MEKKTKDDIRMEALGAIRKWKRSGGDKGKQQPKEKETFFDKFKGIFKKRNR